MSENKFFHEKKQLIKQYTLIIIFIILEALKTAFKGITASTPNSMSVAWGPYYPQKAPRTPQIPSYATVWKPRLTYTIIPEFCNCT